MIKQKISKKYLNINTNFGIFTVFLLFARNYLSLH